MIKSTLILTFLIGISNINFAQQNKLKKDQDAIKNMCGCYEVEFNFAETFSYTDDSTYTPSKVKHSKAMEWAELIEDSEGKIVIQHLLIVGDSTQPMIIKHWRQDWLYENTDFYMFNADNQWKYEQNADVKGQWTQKVYQVDDSPRYEGSATWVHVDGKSYWENTTDAPLPRREYTQRSDYNLTVRRNRHEITKEGWVHDQDNDKVIRTAGQKDVLLAQEKGYNTYKRIDASKCQMAQNWWKDNASFWKDARVAWDNVYGQNNNLALASKVEGKRLYQHLFGMDPAATKPKKIKKVIESFIQE